MLVRQWWCVLLRFAGAVNRHREGRETRIRDLGRLKGSRGAFLTFSIRSSCPMSRASSGCLRAMPHLRDEDERIDAARGLACVLEQKNGLERDGLRPRRPRNIASGAFTLVGGNAQSIRFSIGSRGWVGLDHMQANSLQIPVAAGCSLSNY